MKIAKWLAEATAKLQNVGISTARLDCLVLLEDVTKKNRAYLLAHDDQLLSATEMTKLNHSVNQRLKHLPLAYIRQKTEFYKRTFYINQDVLEPRPESETIIELLLQKPEVRRVIDVGCGSGALAITAKLEIPQAAVLAIDIDNACLRVTKKNSKDLQADIEIQHNDLLQDIDTQRINGAHIIANLPYVPDDFTLNQAALNEPQHAIFGGPDGLDLYRTLFAQLQTTRPASILCESLPTQHQALKAIALNHGFQVVRTEDFIQQYKAN